LYYSNFIDAKDNFSENDFTKCLQTGDDLGKRMSNAFAEAFKTHQKVVIIGSDCAELSSEIVSEAFAALETHDFVIGPAEDGGYYLLGMSAFYPEVFDNIEWSTETVLPHTILNINNLGKNIAYVKTLSDLDNEEDWKRVEHLLVF
jgi:rSAM/selenodomain-associated transferase 1